MGVSCFAQAVDQDDGQLWAVVTGQKSRVVSWVGGGWVHFAGTVLQETSWAFCDGGHL